MVPKKPLQTELKDLDVDRVDGVDRPATGRAFALFKSEGDDLQQIMAAIRRISKSHDDVVNETIATLCDTHIFKMLDSADQFVGYQVRGTDVSSPLLKTLDEAVALVTRVVRGEIDEGRRKAGKPPIDPYGPEAQGLNDMELPAPGVQSPMSEDPDADLRRQMGNTKPTLWERHKNTGPMIDNARQPSTKTAKHAHIL